MRKQATQIEPMGIQIRKMHANLEAVRWEYFDVHVVAVHNFCKSEQGESNKKMRERR